MSTDALLKSLRAALGSVAEDVPAGWMTVRSFAAEWRMSEVNTRRFVAAGLREGILERKTFRVQHTSKIYPVAHFRRLPKKAAESRKPQ